MKSVEEILATAIEFEKFGVEYYTKFHELVRGEGDAAQWSDLGKLSFLSGVQEFPLVRPRRHFADLFGRMSVRPAR